MQTLRTSALLLCCLFGSAARPAAAADVKLNIEKLSSDGMEVRKLTCTLTSGGMLGSMLVIAEMALHKQALDKCASAGAAFATQLTWKVGKTTAAKVTASSDAKADACVLAVLRQTRPAVEGSCTVTLLTGDPVKAEAAARKLGK